MYDDTQESPSIPVPTSLESTLDRELLPPPPLSLSLSQGVHMKVFSKVYCDRVYFLCAERFETGSGFHPPPPLKRHVPVTVLWRCPPPPEKTWGGHTDFGLSCLPVVYQNHGSMPLAHGGGGGGDLCGLFLPAAWKYLSVKLTLRKKYFDKQKTNRKNNNDNKTEINKIRSCPNLPNCTRNFPESFRPKYYHYLGEGKSVSPHRLIRLYMVSTLMCIT